MSNHQPGPHPSAGIIPNKGDDVVDYHAANKSGAGTYASPENEHSGAPVLANHDSDAPTKGQWFQYIKTKQFWITLLLGQGTFNNRKTI
jgi:solute carrier family 35 protein F1/2